MVTLAIRRADSVGPERAVDLDGTPVTIGRSPACTVCLSDQTVSRLHAEISRGDDGSWTISRSKTEQKVWVNGVPVDASPLRGGETIRIGPYLIRFQVPAATASGAAADGRYSATLVVEAGSPSLGRVPLAGPATVIGRSDECAVALVEPMCAERHAAILRVADSFVLRDLGSASGVLLNGHRITSDTELATGDIIEIGRARMSFVVDGVSGRDTLAPTITTSSASGSHNNPFLRMAAAWQRWPAFLQVGTAATVAVAIVALFTVPALLAHRQKQPASAAPREIAARTTARNDVEAAVEEAAAPLAEEEEDAAPPTTDSDADGESPTKTDAPLPSSAEPKGASTAAVEPDLADDDRRAAAPPRATLKDLLDQAEQTPEADDAPNKATSPLQPETPVSRTATGTPTANTSKARLPVPPEDDVAAALKNVEAVYADDFSGPGQIASLLPKLLAAAQKSAKPANKFALLLAAEREAVEASSFRAAVDAFNARAQAFEIDALQGRLDLLLNASKVKGDAAGDLFDLIVDVANDAIATERFDIASKASVLAGNVAADIDQSMKMKGAGGGMPRPASPPDLPSGTSEHPVEIARRLRYTVAETKKLLQKYEAALETLRESPDDEKSLEIVGKYRCFVMGDWQGGLPALAACREEPLAGLASRELALGSGTADPSAIFTLAGEWWSFADTVKRSPSLPAETGSVTKRHAAALYERIVADLADPLEAELARKRIAAAAGESPTRRPPGR